MSGTRSLFRTAPVTEPLRRGDLVIVAHGARGGDGNNRALVDLAARIADRGVFDRVRAGVLKGSPSIETALSGASSARPEVYPLFMSDGYCVREALPARLRAAGRSGQIHRPFGLEPGLAALIARHAVRTLERQGVDHLRARLLLIGHGSSKSGDSRAATEWQAARLRTLGRFAEVRSAYLENAPFLPEVLAGLPAGPCVVVGFFSGAGLHAAEDVPQAIAAHGRDDIVYAGPVTAAPEAAGLIVRSLRRAVTAVA